MPGLRKFETWHAFVKFYDITKGKIVCLKHLFAKILKDYILKRAVSFKITVSKFINVCSLRCYLNEPAHEVIDASNVFQNQ